MKHTIISWDCSYRNFFHLIPSLSQQDFDPNFFEIIYVEQRSKKFSDQYNHKLGLKSLNDIAEEYSDKINVKICYLNEEIQEPYHLGRCVNKGLELANGEIISVMDGDTLVPPNFLTRLTEEHDKQICILNLYRHLSAHPAGVISFSDWKKAEISLSKCIETCFTKYSKITNKYANCGPMISARKEFWDIIEGYDENPFWATSASTLGVDVTRRLEIASDVNRKILQSSYCIHPWHPIGYAKTVRKEQNDLFKKYLNIQNNCTQWSIEKKNPSLKSRNIYAKKQYELNQEFIHSIFQAEHEMITSGEKIVQSTNIKSFRKKSGLSLATSNRAGFYLYKILSLTHVF